MSSEQRPAIKRFISFVAIFWLLAGCTSENTIRPHDGAAGAMATDLGSFGWDGYTETPGAAQKMYQSGVPHTDKSGQVRHQFQEGVSFFPIWMYGQKRPDTNYLCHPDEASKIWSENDPANPARTSNLAALKIAGFNSAQYWGNGEFSGAFLMESERVGLQALFYWQPLDAELTTYSWDSSFGYSGLLDFVARNANHPNILGWIPTEETGRYFSLLEKTPEEWIFHYRDVRNQLKALSPKVVFTLENLWVANQTELTLETDPSGALDAWLYWHRDDELMAVDNYVKNLRRLQTFDQVNGLARGSTFIANTYRGSRPHWAMLNVFEEYADGHTMGDFQFPSPSQLRAMAFISIVHGATGLAYFGSDDYALRKAKMVGMRADTPAAYLRSGWCGTSDWADMLDVSPEKAAESKALWSETTRINGELQSLSSVILSPTSQRVYAVGIKGNPVSPTPIRTMLKFFDGSYYLIAVNLDRVALDAKFVFDGAIDARVDDFFTGRKLTVKRSPNQASFTDSFEPFGVRVFKFK